MVIKKVVTNTLSLTVAAAADKLYLIREERLSTGRSVAELQKQETELKDYLIEQLPKGEANGTMGKIASAYIEDDPKYSVTDWDKVYAVIVKEYMAAKTPEAKLSAFRYLSKALSQEPMQEIWKASKTFPGVQRIITKKVHVVKRAGKK